MVCVKCTPEDDYSGSCCQACTCTTVDAGTRQPSFGMLLIRRPYPLVASGPVHQVDIAAVVAAAAPKHRGAYTLRLIQSGG